MTAADMPAGAADRDTIVAVATGAAGAGVGIVRVSGPAAGPIAERLLGAAPRPRHAHFCRFTDADARIIDDGLLLHFPGPASYTGEDVLELHGHGNRYLLNALVERCCALGARPARAGEFTERAFLNGKLDLAQAEAVADLIAAGSEAAARAARRSLDGAFSKQVAALLEALTGLRIYIEAAIDFPEEEIDFLAGPEVRHRLADTRTRLAHLLREAERGVRLRDGLHVVIVGPPNAGKSSLLNALAGGERAIVTETAGTTRDLIRETVRIDGIELTLVDTAGLRESPDRIEAEGIRRAREEMARADLLLLVDDDSRPEAERGFWRADLPAAQMLWLHSKIDLSATPARSEDRADGRHLWLSASTGEGLDALRSELRRAAGQGEGADGAFSARARHLDALHRVAAQLELAGQRLYEGAGELAAEDLRLAQDALGEITGRLTSDALLGEIFGRFCIGK
jgi:tRNA modification GTPase